MPITKNSVNGCDTPIASAPAAAAPVFNSTVTSAFSPLNNFSAIVAPLAPTNEKYCRCPNGKRSSNVERARSIRAAPAIGNASANSTSLFSSVRAETSAHRRRLSVKPNFQTSLCQFIELRRAQFVSVAQRIDIYRRKCQRRPQQSILQNQFGGTQARIMRLRENAPSNNSATARNRRMFMLRKQQKPAT